MYYVAKLIWWAPATRAIWLIYDHTLMIVANDVLSALAATLLVILGSVLIVMIHAGRWDICARSRRAGCRTFQFRLWGLPGSYATILAWCSWSMPGPHLSRLVRLP